MLGLRGGGFDSVGIGDIGGNGEGPRRTEKRALVDGGLKGFGVTREEGELRALLCIGVRNGAAQTRGSAGDDDYGMFGQPGQEEAHFRLHVLPVGGTVPRAGCLAGNCVR